MIYFSCVVSVWFELVASSARAGGCLVGGCDGGGGWGKAKVCLVAGKWQGRGWVMLGAENSFAITGKAGVFCEFVHGGAHEDVRPGGGEVDGKAGRATGRQKVGGRDAGEAQYSPRR